jgi:hypothetical protein
MELSVRQALKAFAVFTIALLPMLGGCGTYVPSIQEIGDDTNGLLLVQAIIESIHCELRNSVTQIYWDDQTVKKRRGTRVAEYFDKWGAQVQLQLTVEETTRLNPSASWMPNALFSLGGTATLSADATRINKITYFYRVSELRQHGGCQTGAPDTPHPPGSLLIQSNLKLYNWLSTLMLGTAAGDISTISKQNSLTHEVKFEVVSTGTLAPAWVLSRVFSVNQSNPLFSTTRDRTHDLLVTFGPIDETQIQTLAPTAQNTFFASQINQNLSVGAIRIVQP